MGTFSFENQGLNTFLVYKLDEEEVVDQVACGMLDNNEIPNSAKFIFFQNGEERNFKFNVSSHVSLKQILAGEVNKEQLLTALESIFTVLKEAKGYLLDEKGYVLQNDYIYINISTNQCRLIYLPVIECKEANSGEEFVKNIMFTSRFNPNDDSTYVMRIMNYINSSEKFNDEVFLKLVKELKGGVSAANAPAKAPVTQEQPVQVPPQGQPVQAAPQGQPRPMSPQGQPAQTAPQGQPAPMAPQGQARPMAPQGQPAQMPPQGQARPMAPQGQPAPVAPAVPSPRPNQQMQSHIPPQKEKKGLFGFGKKSGKGANNVVAQSTVPSNIVMPQGQPRPMAPQGQPGQMPPQGQPGQMAPQGQPRPMAPQGQPGQVPPQGQPAPMAPQSQPVPPAPAPMAPQSQPVPPAPAPMAPQSQPVPPASNNAPMTTVLGVSNAAGETTVLSVSSDKVEPYLIRQRGNEKIMIDKNVFRIGKEKSYVHYFVSNNTAVSRSHADILVENGECYIIDNNSLNHTYINGKQIQSQVKVKLSTGDKIKLADELFDFYM